ncbi:MAG: site-specific integrase [Methanocorpusculum sp.]|nr:site-specific integrase [Methanocorpusculum sp.]MDE2524210.1 site-specific integrase [Methanocorpusculum sp.]
MYSVLEYVEAKRTAATKKMVVNVMNRFFRFIYDEKNISDINAVSLEYLQSERDFFGDLRDYIDQMIHSGLAPKTISVHFSYIRHWLSWNGVSFDPVQSSLLFGKLPRAVAIHDEDFLDREKISSILAHSDVLMRAVVLVLSSSGMRVGECLAIRPEQIQGKEIHMRAEQMKAGKPHVYFVSEEAVSALSEWDKMKDEYMRRAGVKTRKCLGRDVAYLQGVFPFQYQTIRLKFENALKRADLFEKDTAVNRSRITLHSIRKWTDSTMKMYISSNLANALIGHFEPGDTSYRRYTREQLREAYATVEPHLVILAPQEYAELKSETQQQLASHDKLLVGLMEDNYQMKQDNKVIKETLDSLVRYLESGK